MTRSEIIEIVFNELQEKFASKAQQRFLYSQKPKVAKKLASKMTKKDYKELPNKVEEDFPKQYADAFAKATGNRYDYNIEVSVANSAREAMQIYKDGRWEGDGIIQTSTNTYGSNDQDSMYGFLETLEDQGVEIVTHDLEESVNEATMKGTYAGRPVVINKKGSDMSKWTVTFTKTKKTVPIADVIANLKDDKGRRFSESVNELKLKKKKGVELTYGQAMSTNKLDKQIKSYIEDNYPKDYNPGVSRYHGGRGPVGMTGKQGHSLSTTHIMKLAKFAKKNKDKGLAKLLDQWVKVAKANDLIESIDMTKSHLKQIIKEELVNVLNEASYAQTLYQTKDLIKQFKAFMFNKFDKSDPIWCDQDKLKMFFKVFKDQVTKETKPTCD